jgi:hypothetical protein
MSQQPHTALFIIAAMLLAALPMQPLSAQDECERQSVELQDQDPQRAQDQQKHKDAKIEPEKYLRYLKEARVEQIKLRLGVSEERASAIADKWAELESPIRQIQMAHMEVWRKMMFIVQEVSPDKEKSRKIKPLNERYMELRKEMHDAHLRLYTELPKMGDSPIQQARMLFVMEDMERKERDGLRAVFGKRKQEPK